MALPTDRQFDGLSLAKLLPSGLPKNDSAHATLFHPLSGAGGGGPLDAMRYGDYKVRRRKCAACFTRATHPSFCLQAHWTTGGAPDCGGAKSSVKVR